MKCAEPRPKIARIMEKQENIILNVVQNLINSEKGESEGGENTEEKKDENAGANAQAQISEKQKKPLEEEALQFLEERIITERKYDEPIQDDLAVRVTDIVTLGLQDNEIKMLTEAYFPPSNCKLIDPPKVNVEMMSKDAAGIVIIA